MKPVFALFFSAVLLIVPSLPALTQPNVILILADDMAVGDLGALNGGITRTPNLDKLLKEGLWFDQAYSASCVCAPARAALLTGRYPHRTGVVSLTLDKEPELTRLKRDETTLADIFSANGYHTGLIGKWHTGLGEGYGPIARGFREVSVFHGSDGGGYNRYVLHEDDDMEGKPEQQDVYLTTELNTRARSFVRRHVDKPFFLHLAHYAPHRPLQAPEEAIKPFVEAGFDHDTATVYAMIQIMDRGLGELFDDLDQLGIREKTLILFASDNGRDILVPDRFNLGLRGGKYMVYEGGIRVPFIANWRDSIQPGKTATPVHFTDVLPTLVEVCGLRFEPKLPIDGRSFAPLLMEVNAPAPHPLFWQWNRHEPNYTHNAALRDGPWKLIRPYVTKNQIKDDSDLPHALYNLDDDPAETNDLTAQQPGRVQAMSAALDAWCREVEQERLR